MPNIKFPDGKSINFKNDINGFQIAEKISKSLAKQALIMSVNGCVGGLFLSFNLVSVLYVVVLLDYLSSYLIIKELLIFCAFLVFPFMSISDI